MAIPEANLDEYDKEAQDVLNGGGGGIGEGPVPDLEDVNPTPPTTVEAEGPEEFGGLPPTAPAPAPEPVPIGAQNPEVPAGGTPPAAAAPASEDLIRKQGALDVQKANIEAATAARQAQEAQLADEDARLERAEYLQRRQDAERDLDARIKAYESTKLTDPRMKTNGLKSKLGVIFGGLGAGLSAAGGGSGENTFLSNLQKQWEDDTALQKANISALRDSAVMARTRLEDVDAGRRTMLRDADARLVAKYNLALKQGEAQLRNQGASQAQIDTDARIAQLRKGQLAAKLQAQKDEDAHQLAQARIASLNARAARDRARGAGRGGGGGTNALGEFARQAGALGPGDPIPPDLVMLGRRAGLKPNQIAAEVDKYRGSGAKAAKAGIQVERQLSKEAEAWSKKNNIPALIKKQDELSAVTEELENAPHNPLQQALAVEKAVSSARGGAASKQALALALEHLGQKYQSLDDVKRAIINKELGEKQMDNFIGFIRNQLGAAQGEGAKKYAAYEKFVASQPPERRAELEAQRGQIFSGLHGFGGESEAAPPRPTPAKPSAAPAKAGPTPEVINLAKKEIAHPTSPERLAKARAVLHDAGAI